MPRRLPPYKLAPPNGGNDGILHRSGGPYKPPRRLMLTEPAAALAPARRTTRAFELPSPSPWGVESVAKWLGGVAGTAVAMGVACAPLLHYLKNSDIQETMKLWSSIGIEVGLANALSWLLYTAAVYQRDKEVVLLIANSWFCAVSLSCLMMMYGYLHKVTRGIFWFVFTMIGMIDALIILQAEPTGKWMLLLEYIFGVLGICTIIITHFIQIYDLCTATKKMQVIAALSTVGPGLTLASVQCLIVFTIRRNEMFLVISCVVNFILYPVELFLMSTWYPNSESAFNRMKPSMRNTLTSSFRQEPYQTDIESQIGVPGLILVEDETDNLAVQPHEGHNIGDGSSGHGISSNVSSSASSSSSEPLSDDILRLWRLEEQRAIQVTANREHNSNTDETFDEYGDSLQLLFSEEDLFQELSESARIEGTVLLELSQQAEEQSSAVQVITNREDASPDYGEFLVLLFASEYQSLEDGGARTSDYGMEIQLLFYEETSVAEHEDSYAVITNREDASPDYGEFLVLLFASEYQSLEDIGARTSDYGGEIQLLFYEATSIAEHEDSYAGTDGHEIHGAGQLLYGDKTRKRKRKVNLGDMLSIGCQPSLKKLDTKTTERQEAPLVRRRRRIKKIIPAWLSFGCSDT